MWPAKITRVDDQSKYAPDHASCARGAVRTMYPCPLRTRPDTAPLTPTTGECMDNRSQAFELRGLTSLRQPSGEGGIVLEKRQRSPLSLDFYY
ncbi:hypothetical protein [Paenibacillus sp. CR_12]|uniref:hypothetical protein n=1 Tax=Paenibacillus sp. CR_12 TaxID=3055793 RepID=UPI0035BF0251